MKSLRNENGVALMMTLMVAAIALAVMSTLLYMMATGSKISGLNKRYTTALEAAKGGHSVTRNYVSSRGTLGSELESAIGYTRTTSDTCAVDKLLRNTQDWDSSCDSSLVIDSGDPSTYDYRFILENYEIMTKIVNTVEGNTGRGSVGQGGGSRGVAFSGKGVITPGSRGGVGGIATQQIPYLYSIELEARRVGASAKATEKAKLSILYQY